MGRKIAKEYDVGDTIQNDKVDVVIIDKEIRYIKEKYNYKGQKYKDTPRLFYYCHCNKCNNDYWKRKADVEVHGCPICSKSTFVVVQGYNDLATLHPDLIQYFISKGDAYTHSVMSNKDVELHCPICGFEKSMPVSRLVRQGFGCPFCSDGTSYPEKFFISFLKQLNVSYVYQLSKKKLEWCDKYKYDFYLTDYNLIVEVHGGQHYEDTSWCDYRIQKDNDEKKKQLALKQGVNYIVIDARNSDKDFLMNSILNSNLNQLFSLQNIDWNKCDRVALSSYVKQACNLWNNGYTTGEIAEYIGVTVPAIQDYLKKGSAVNLCDYTPDEGRKRALADTYKKMRKRVAVYKNGVFIKEFNSIRELENQSLKCFGRCFSEKRVSEACRGIRNPYEKYGYTFEKISEEDRKTTLHKGGKKL